MSHLRAVIPILFPQDRKRAVPLKWLLSRSSLLDKAFVGKATVSLENHGIFSMVKVNGEVYVWPKDADKSSLLTILSELQNPNDPHHYLFGETQIHKDDVVIDIGACEGSFSARAAELGGRVIAVEPSKLMTSVITMLFELRHLQAPIIANVLLGQAIGELHFIDNQHNPGASRVVEQPEQGSYPVTVSTLDALVESLKLEKVDFIKCDAEGADVDILKSGSETLKHFRPKIAVTTYHNSADYSDLCTYLETLGYHTRGKGLLYSAGEYRVLMLHAWHQ